MSADLLTEIPRLGVLTSLMVDGDPFQCRAWFHLLGTVVMRRGLGDLTSWSHCSLESVVEFTPDEVQP